MRNSLTSWATALVLAVPSFASHGLIYTSNHHVVDNTPTSLTASDARLLIAQRLGLSKYHSLEGASDTAIGVLNEYGARSHLFFSEKQARLPSGLVLIEGIAELDDSFLGEHGKPLKLDQCPSPATNTLFFDDLTRQHASISASDASVHNTGDSLKALQDIRDWLNNAKDGATADLLLHTKAFTGLTANSKEYKQSVAELKSLLAQCLSSQGHVEMTVVLFSPESNGFFKRSSTASWGQYRTLAKRDYESDMGGIFPDKAADKIDYYTPEDYVPQVEPVQLDQVAPLQSNVTPPRGILPQCYTSKESCEEKTHSCSGHGSCQLKYTTKDDNYHCYSCACESTKEQVGSGYKTTVWAGPACQKKDVSVSFWLLATTAVGLVSAIVWGIGLLYSMGSEDLPSVIGAGVAVGGSRSK